MNEQIEKLIRELSDKLGVTADHLWSVLVRQAAITGWIDAAVCVAWCVMLVMAFKLVSRKTKEPPATPEERYPRAEWEGDGKGIAWIILVAAMAATALVIGTNLSNIVGAICNPEYWALKQIIGSN